MLNDSDADGAAGSGISGVQQFAVLHQHFPRVSNATKCIVLSTYAKMQHLYPELKTQVRAGDVLSCLVDARGYVRPRPCAVQISEVFEQHTSAMDAELQQRAVEYFHLPELAEEAAAAVLDAMPAFPERESVLETRLKKAGEENQDKDVFGKSEKPATTEGVEDDEESGFGGGGHALKAKDAPAADVIAPAIDSDSGGLDDLLGMGSSAPAPPAADASTVPVTTRIGIDASLTEQVPKWFSTVIVRPSGAVLYEDAYVQVCGCAYEGG
jgi:hypothetical protein